MDENAEKEKRYPWDYDTDEIKQRVYEQRDTLGRPRGADARQEIIADIDMGMNELQWRATEKANQTAEKSYETATLSARSSNRLSRLAIILSTIAIIVTALFGYLDYVGDKDWQSKQIQLLEGLLSTEPSPPTEEGSSSQSP